MFEDLRCPSSALVATSEDIQRSVGRWAEAADWRNIDWLDTLSLFTVLAERIMETVPQEHQARVMAQMCGWAIHEAHVRGIEYGCAVGSFRVPGIIPMVQME